VDAKSIAKQNKETAAAKKKKEMEEFATKQTLDNIEFTTDNKDVLKIGGVPWTKLLVKAKKAFCTANNIPIPQNMRNGDQIGKVIANWVNSAEYRESVQDRVSKKAGGKKAAATKPACLELVGTMFRVVNCIISCKAAFMATKATHDREDQDSRNPKQVAWDTMTHYYNDQSNEDLNELLPEGIPSLVGYNIDVCCSYEFDDQLRLADFEELVLYLHAHYRVACNSKTTSTGQHKGFDAHCGGKAWLIYYHALLSHTKHHELGCFAFPALPEAVMQTSSSHITPLKRNTSQRNQLTVSSRKVLGGQNTRGVETAAAATIGAMGAVSTRMKGLHDTDNFNREVIMKTEMRKMRELAMQYGTEYLQLRGSVKQAMNTGDKQQMDEAQDKRNKVKILQRSYTKEYKELKEKLGYESEVCSDASLPSDDDSI